MAGKKRRATSKAAAAKKTGTAKSAAAASKDEVEASLCSAVLSNLIDIASSQERSGAVLQAFIDQKCWTDSEEMENAEKVAAASPSSSRSVTTRQQQASPHLDCYWIVLATNIMARLLVLKETQAKKAKEEHLVKYLASLSDLTATILLSDKTNLEKACQFQPSRSILCQAILSATISSFYAIRKYDPNDNVPDKDESQPHQTLERAVSTMNRLVFLRASSQNDGMSASPDTSDSQSTVVTWSLDALEDDCTQVEDLLGSTCKLEQECLEALTVAVSSDQNLVAAPSEPPPAKRAARSRRGASKPAPTSPSASSTSESQFKEAVTQTVSSFAKLLTTKDFGTRIDGRVLAKRWASIALVWSQNGDGQSEILKEMLRFGADDISTKVMSNIQQSRLLNQLLSVVSEIGTQGGVRPATGGFEQYIRGISPPLSGKAAKTSSSQAKSPRRKDIRDLATFAIFTILQNHKKCLQEIAHTNPTVDVVNDQDADKTVAEARQGVTLAPELSTAISRLCGSAASSVPNSSYADQAQWSKTMTAIACAHILELLADSTLPLDCRLAKLALSQFSDSLRTIDQQALETPTGSRVRDISIVDRTRDTSKEELQDRLEKQYNLSEPLRVPFVALDRQKSTKKGKATTEAPNDCTYAGTFEPGISITANSFTDEQAICLLIRGLNGQELEANAPTSKILPFLVSIVRRTYDTRDDTERQVDDEAASQATATSRKRKRTTRKGSSSRASVSRKTEAGKVAVTNDNVNLKPISAARASTAVQALGALQACFTRSKGASFSLSQLIRTIATAKDVYDILALGSVLDKIMAPYGSDPSGSQDLTYRAHVRLCQVLGRGQTTYERRLGLDTNVWDSTMRTKVYSLLASQGETDQPGSNSKWPLSLSAAQHAFFAANMTCTKYGDVNVPESMVVDGTVKSILEILKTLCDAGVVEENSDRPCVLSYNDERTFMLALNELPIDERRKHLDALVQGVLTLLQSTTNSQSKKKTLLSNTQAIGFLSRVLVMCYSMVHTVIAGEELRLHFIAQMGSFCPVRSIRSVHASWHQQENTFLGLFGSWDSPALPETVSERNASIVARKTLDELKTVFEIAFSLAFECASRDFCHLLFVAWNGLDALPKGMSEDEPTCSFNCSGTDYSTKILRMRNDICSTQKCLATLSAPRLRATLKHMIIQANSCVERIAAEYIPEDSEIGQTVPASVMALLATLPGYIAFAIAGFTRRGNDYFSKNLVRSSGGQGVRERAYSSESEPSPSDIDSEAEGEDSEIRESALSRLRQICEAMGAAPIHPDWLDTTCRLRHGLSFEEVTEIAELAMKTISRLASISFRQFKKYQMLALSEAAEKNLSTERRNLVSSLLHGSDSFLPVSREWSEDIASIAGCSVEVLEELLEDSVESEVHRVRAAFCPVSGQGLVGNLQEGHRLQTDVYEISTAELRAGGEWELLLSTALPVACLDLEGMREASEVGVLSRESRAKMEYAKAFRNICFACVENLVPVAALTRMAVGKVGRASHPFSSNDNSDDPYDVMPLHFSERPPITGHTSSSLKTTVAQTLVLLARLCLEDDSVNATCQVIASHLLCDTDSFSHLESLSAVRCAFVSIRHAIKLAETDKSKSRNNSTTSIIGQLLSTIDEHGHLRMSSDDADYVEPENFEVLHTFLGSSQLSQLECITEPPAFPIDTLKKGQMTALEEAAAPYSWSQSDRYSNSIRDLVFLLHSGSLCNDDARSTIARLLSRLSWIEAGACENDSTMPSASLLVLPATIKAFNGVEETQLRTIVTKHLTTNEMSTDLSRLLSLLLFVKGGHQAFAKSRFVHDILLKLFDSWKKIPNPAKGKITEAFIAYGIRFQDLATFGTKLIEVTSKSGEMDALCNFCAVLCSVKASTAVTDDGKSIPAESFEEPKASQEDTPSQDSLSFPNSCSFIQKSGFHEQHWYHCTTCGMVDDRGVCTLCALVCHKNCPGVFYSRYSSFFCDCAAENGSSSERVSCQCLAALPAKQINELKEIESRKLAHETKEPGACEKVLSSPLLYSLTREEIDQHAWLNGIETSTVESLFKNLESVFLKWKNEMREPTMQFLDHEKDNPVRQLVERIPHTDLLKDLRGRNGSVLDLQQLKEAALVPVYTATGFGADLSEDSASSAIARLSRNKVSRRILATFRGRLFVAQKKQITFLSPLITNVRHVQQQNAVSVQRDSMPLLGNVALNFSIMGMEIGSNEELLVVWGNAQVNVLLLSKDLEGVDETMNLTFEIDADDYILRAQFLPGSDSIVVVSCTRFVRLYDITRVDSKFKSSTSEKRVNPVIGYNLGFEASLRDVALSCKRCGERDENSMFLLLENGRIHELMIKTSLGKIESPSDLQFEPSECVLIPTAGMRQRPSSPPNPPGSSSRTLGEGSKLEYLKQSRLLLYKCTSTSVLALMLDENGNVEGSFELLPHAFEIDGLSLSGPYSHWTELGVVYKDSGEYFRLACVCRLSNTREHKLLIIEFNKQKSIYARVITCSDPGDLEGIAAFSAPILEQESNKTLTGERVFLTTLTSGGSLICLGDSSVDVMPLVPQPDSREVQLLSLCSNTQVSPSFPLTLFERLTNVTEAVDIRCEGLDIPSDDLKRRLSRDESSSVTIRGGSCMSFSLPSENSQVISAIRVCLGGDEGDSSISSFFVAGRKVDVTSPNKQWYNLPLTDEEVAVGVRTNFISVRIPTTYEFFALEVYANRIDNHVIPRSYFADHLSATTTPTPLIGRFVSDQSSDSTQALALAVSAISNFFELSKSLPVISNYAKSIFWLIVEETAVHPDFDMRRNLQALMKHVEPDADKRNREYDSRALRRCHKVLEDCSQLASSAAQTNDATEAERSWTSVRLVLTDCLNTLRRIGTDRPIHYLQNLGDVEPTKSLALEVSKLVLAGMTQSSGFEDLTMGAVEIELIEMAMKIFSDSSKQREATTPKIVPQFSKYLSSPNKVVIERCCDAISTFFKDRRNLFVTLKGARLVAYQCDACETCPIKKARFTQDEQEGIIDLCKECYEKAGKFVEKRRKKKSYTDSVLVEVDGKQIDGLSCKEFDNLQAVSTEKFELASTRTLTQDGEDGDLDRALQLSLHETTSGFETLLSNLFTFLLPLLVKEQFSVPLLGLLLDLINNSKPRAVMERAGVFVREVSGGVRSFLAIVKQGHEKLSKDVAINLARAIRSLIDLVTPFDEGSQPPKKTGAKLCSVHGLPTVKRKCKDGPNRDRRFWVCGMEREKRCDYFEWADEASNAPSEKSGKGSKRDRDARKDRIDLLKTMLFSETGLLHEHLCQALEDEYISDTDTGTASERKKKQNGAPCQLGKLDTEKEYREGVLCSKEKLSDTLGETVLREQTGASEHCRPLLEATCDLLKLISDYKTQGIERWISLLCRLDMHSSASVRHLSKTTLRSMCGGDDSLCRSISDTHSFTFYVRKLLHLSSDVIDAGVIAKEKTRMCGPDWNGAAVRMDTLTIAGLAGTSSLIPEDTITDSDSKKIGKVLDSIDKIMKDGGQVSLKSWRKFCGSSALAPVFGKGSPKDYQPTIVQLTSTAPIISLLWLACALPNSLHQAKTLRLIDVALFAGRSNADSTTPEEMLSPPDGPSQKDDLLALSLCLAHNGATTELRKAGRQVVSKLFLLLSQAEQRSMYEVLVVCALKDIGVRGRSCTEVLNLLQEMTTSLNEWRAIGAAATSVMQACHEQVQAIKHDRSNYWIPLDSKRIVDMSDCNFCAQHVPSRSKSHSEAKKTGEAGGHAAPDVRGSTLLRQKWHREQVSPFIRQRLEMEKTSDEFNLYFRLKYRVAISELFLNISDPRGRYAKVVQIYYTPRQVGEVTTLKTGDYSSKWQRAATIRLARGASRSSVGLSSSIVAANIRLHFEEFYQRPGEGSRAADGSLLVLCPRCAHPVTNLAGVCGRCGEVTTQCRKCRRINYDTTDAFLCKDCTFCAHGQISLEVNAGIATNALAITDDKDSAKTRKMLGFAQSLEDELRDSLRKKVQPLTTTESDSIFGPAMQQAFLGLPPSLSDDEKGSKSTSPLDWLDKQGSVVKAVARPDSSHGGSSRSLSSTDRSERTRSLLNLARQIRNDSGASRAINLDSLEELLGGDGNLEQVTGRGGSTDATQPGDTNDDGNQEGDSTSDAEETQKLIMLTREAARERYALQRRLNSWEALNSGCLVNTTPNATSFSPSHCSHCSSTVAYHLLELWVRMFNVSPFDVQVDESIVKMLLFEDTSTQSKAVVECKKRAVISIATKSHTGAEMVLAAMRRRLSACEDKFCTHCLGKVLESGDFAHPSIAAEFTKLAMEILSSRSVGNL